MPAADFQYECSLTSGFYAVKAPWRAQRRSLFLSYALSWREPSYAWWTATILHLANRLCPLFVAIFIFLRQNPAFCNKFCRNFLLLLEIREETQYSSFELLMDPEAKSTYLHGDNRRSSCYTGIPICPIHVLQLSELVSDTVDVLLPLHPLFSCPLPLPINKLRRCF